MISPDVGAVAPSRTRPRRATLWAVTLLANPVKPSRNLDDAGLKSYLDLRSPTVFLKK
jgi:hypothetical protein